MCLGIPVRIETVDGNSATAAIGSVRRNIGIELTPDVKKGDYVLLHAGFSIQKLEPADAKETLRLLKEMYSQDLTEEIAPPAADTPGPVRSATAKKTARRKSRQVKP